MITGENLIADIDGFRPAAGQMGLWWLGQHSFVLKCGAGALPAMGGKARGHGARATVLYIDPFLTAMPGRLIPPLLAPVDITHADFILGTHDHADHIDRDAWPGLATASPEAKFVVPGLFREGLSRDLKIPLDRLIGMDDGGSCEGLGVKVSAVASAHELLDPDPATGRFPSLGYVIEASGRTVYHSGDCCVYEGLVTKLRRWRIDLALLPINGRDARRLSAGCIGNMTYQEAADLAGAIGAAAVIPAHYDMFATNLGSPREFLDYVRVKYPRMKSRLCEYGRRLIVPDEL